MTAWLPVISQFSSSGAFPRCPLDLDFPVHIIGKMGEELEEVDGWLGWSVVKFFPQAKVSLFPVNVHVH